VPLPQSTDAWAPVLAVNETAARAAVFHAGTGELLVIDAQGGVKRLLSPRQEAGQPPVGIGGFPPPPGTWRWVAISPDGTRVAVMPEPEKLQVIDCETRRSSPLSVPAGQLRLETFRFDGPDRIESR